MFLQNIYFVLRNSVIIKATQMKLISFQLIVFRKYDACRFFSFIWNILQSDGISWCLLILRKLQQIVEKKRKTEDFVQNEQCYF